MTEIDPALFGRIYQYFSAPVTRLDCGKKCGPHNLRGAPFCCDLDHSIPAAYQKEWEYLQSSTDLWRRWEEKTPGQERQLRRHLQEGQQLIGCKGHRFCQREYRSIACRAFPFFPYLSSQGEFLGLSYYREYRDRCWVISHLDQIEEDFLARFVKAFKELFSLYPDSRRAYQGYSRQVRRQTAQKGEQLVLLKPSKEAWQIDPQTEKETAVKLDDLPAFAPYDIIRQMPFPDELEERNSLVDWDDGE